MQSLDLSSTRLSKAGLRECGSLENLRELKLSQTDLTDDGVAELRGLKHLVTLDLSVNPITDRALHELGPLERLTSLNLSATAITDGGLKALRRLKDLTELQLDYTDIDGSGLKDLGEVDKLAKLNLDGTKLSDAGILGLRNLRKLAELRLPDRADRYEIKTNVSLLDGWRVSPDFQRLIVPLWIKPEAAAPRVFAASYSPIALLQLDRPNEIRILPDTGVDRNALPAYLGHFTAWSANSSCLAYFGEFDSGARGWGFGNKVRWQPVCLNLKTGKTEVLQSVDFGSPPLNSRAAIHLSPSGRYVLIPTLVNPSDQRAGLRFLLWEPAAGTVRELLRAEHASGWEPYEATLAWSGDEKTIYLAVGASDGNEVETWRLCECPLDGRLPYSPQTARVLFTLTNEKGYRETRPERRIPFVIDRNLQILELRPKEDALVFYRGDTRSYWTLKLTTGRLQERFPSPFVLREKGAVRFNEQFAESWMWRDTDMLAIVRGTGQARRLLVGNPVRAGEFREVARGAIKAWYFQWITPEWLAYVVWLDAGPEHSHQRQLWAVNIRTKEKRLLLSTDLTGRIARQFLADVSRRNEKVRKERSSAANN